MLLFCTVYREDDKNSYVLKSTWKSIAVTYSNDNGITWERSSPILTSYDTQAEKINDTTSKYGGMGDMCVIWNNSTKQWIMYYNEKGMGMAMSDDIYAAPNTWYKIDPYNTTNRSPGLAGKSYPVDVFSTPSTIKGANPSISYSQYSHQYFIIWHSWTGALYYSTSFDLFQWNNATMLIDTSNNITAKFTYPTFISNTSDYMTDKDGYGRVYYAQLNPQTGFRKWLYVDVRF